MRLHDHVGRYYSPELTTEYELRIVGGTLVGRHPRRPDILLRPYQPDRMFSREWFFQNLEFQRDADGRVIGFRLSGVNAENGVQTYVLDGMSMIRLDLRSPA